MAGARDRAGAGLKAATATLWRPRNWNVRASSAGYVTHAEVRQDFLARYRVEEAGGKAHREYRIPAEDLADFNAAIVGPIEVIRRVRE